MRTTQPNAASPAPGFLDEMDLYPTMKCNLACDFCSVRANEHSDQEMPLARLVELITEAHGLGLKELHLCGGEPTLRDDLEPMVAAAARLGIRTRLITNGFRLEPARILRLRATGLAAVMVSVDGFEGTHNAFRGHRQAFQRAMATVRESVAAGLSTRVSSVVFMENLNEIVPLMAFLDRIGVSVYSAFLGAPLGRGRDNRIQSVVPPQRWQQLCEDVRDATRRHGLRMKVSLTKGFISSGSPSLNSVGLRGRGTGCSTLLDDFNYLIVRADGNLYQCVFFVTDGPPIGNVAQISLAEALSRARERAVYREFTKPRRACASCEQLAACGGGCRGNAYLYTGNWLAPDPRCVKDSSGAPQTLPLCPILKLNPATGKLGGSTEQALETVDAPG
jgi:radical SAM protein with 4Fe4S-binding SPASM domain